MSALTRKIEVLANVAIILVAILLGIVLVQQFIRKEQPQTPSIVAGTKLRLPDIDWEHNRRTLLLVLQQGCHFCTESAPFYQRLVRETAGREDINLVAVLPQDVNTEQVILTS